MKKDINQSLENFLEDKPKNVEKEVTQLKGKGLIEVKQIQKVIITENGKQLLT